MEHLTYSDHMYMLNVGIIQQRLNIGLFNVNALIESKYYLIQI